jgi:hypothetical protein
LFYFEDANSDIPEILYEENLFLIKVENLLVGWQPVGWLSPEYPSGFAAYMQSKTLKSIKKFHF